MNPEHYRRYARLLVEHGLGLRPRQPLYVYGQVAHRELIALVTEVAYGAGSGRVETRLFDPVQKAALIRHGRLEDIELSHTENQAWLNDVVRNGGAYLGLVGPEDPHLWTQLARDHPRRHAAYQRGAAAAASGFRRYGVEGHLSPWVTAPCPTEGWARRLFPSLGGAAALDRLAALVFAFSYADREAALELAAARSRRLSGRCRKLDALGITEIRLRGGATDLRLGLSPRARWLGGSLRTTAGQDFHPNVPSEEVYTTPDKRRAEGRLAIVRPFRIRRGALVEGLVLRFRGGRVVDFEASRGSDAFGRWLATDEGARRLGEIALVGEDSIIGRSGLFFDLNLLDENTASHVALGQGFSSAFAGEAQSCNRSAVHMDLVFGSPELTITASESREGEVALLDRGGWAERFA